MKNSEIIAVAALTAGTARPFATITATWRRTSSAAISGNPVILIVGPAILDGEVLALDESGLVQALPERTDKVR